MPSRDAASVPWDTIRRLRTHLEYEQRHAFVDALDKLGEKACEAEWLRDELADLSHDRAVLDVIETARYLTKEPFGALNERSFYRLREALIGLE